LKIFDFYVETSNYKINIIIYLNNKIKLKNILFNKIKIFYIFMEEEFIKYGLINNIEGNYDTAIEQFTKAITKNEQSYKGYLYRASAYTNKGEYNKALNDFEKAEKLRNEDDEFYYLRGKAYFYNQNFNNAKSDFEKALTINSINEENKENINKLLTFLID